MLRKKRINDQQASYFRMYKGRFEKEINTRRARILFLHLNSFNTFNSTCALIEDPLYIWGAQWLSGIVFNSRSRIFGFDPQWRHCVVSLSKTQ